MSFTAYPTSGGLLLQAQTNVAGFALQNGTPTILSWTVPNDGRLHRAMWFSELNVTSGQTGGIVWGTWTYPSGNNAASAMYAGGLSAGQNYAWLLEMVQPGSTVTVVQNTAQTGGAATFYGEIWGS